MTTAHERVMVPLDQALYAEVLQVAAYFDVPVDEWIERAVREKLTTEPIRPPVDSEEGPARTPYAEAGVTTRDSHSSAG